MSADTPHVQHFNLFATSIQRGLRQSIAGLFLASFMAALIVGRHSGEFGRLLYHQMRWELQRVGRYQFTYTQICHCTLRGRDRTSTVDDASLNDPEALGYDGRPTQIEGMFTLAWSALISWPDSIHIQYDPVYNFPATIDVDPINQATDDEVVHLITDFAIRPQSFDHHYRVTSLKP